MQTHIQLVHSPRALADYRSGRKLEDHPDIRNSITRQPDGSWIIKLCGVWRPAFVYHPQVEDLKTKDHAFELAGFRFSNGSVTVPVIKPTDERHVKHSGKSTGKRNKPEANRAASSVGYVDIYWGSSAPPSQNCTRVHPGVQRRPSSETLPQVVPPVGLEPAATSGMVYSPAANPNRRAAHQRDCQGGRPGRGKPLSSCTCVRDGWSCFCICP